MPHGFTRSVFERLLPPQDWKIGAQVKPELEPRAIKRCPQVRAVAVTQPAKRREWGEQAGV